MRKATTRLLSWVFGTAIGIFGMVASRRLYYESLLKIKDALFNLDFNLLSSQDFWIGLLLPFVMLAAFITVGKAVAHLSIKMICKVIY